MAADLTLGSTVSWGPQKMPAVVLSVGQGRVELAYRRRRQLRTGFTAIGSVEPVEATPEHRRIAAEVAPRLQLGLFD
jgi:glutathione synthase/RimK-type ligase-like ATP-grasp enzyme